MTTHQIDIHGLPGRAKEVMAWVDAGDDVYLVRHGSVVFKLVPPGPDAPPPETPRERVLGLHPGAIIIGPDFNDPLPASFWPEDPG